jgi:hypothetical protein
MPRLGKLLDDAPVDPLICVAPCEPCGLFGSLVLEELVRGYSFFPG